MIEIHESAALKVIDGVGVIAGKLNGKACYLARFNGVHYIGLTPQEAVANAKDRAKPN